MSAAPSSLYAALVEAQSKFPAVAKDSTNPHFSSKFVSLDALIAATRPVLNAAGLAITQFPTVDEAGQAVLKTTIMHAASGEQLFFVTPLFISRNDSQGFGSATTYARRYAWAAALGIASEEDTDGEVPAKAAEKAKPAEKAVRMASKPQIAKMAVIVKALNEAGMAFPAEYASAENWGEALKQRVRENYGVESRNDLTSAQASELIDWLESQEVPF